MIATTFLTVLTLGPGVLPFVVSSPTSTAPSDPIHVPLTRRFNRAHGLHDLPKAADHLRAKYKFETIRSKRKRAGNTAAAPITNLVCCLCMELSVLNNL
jgi:hypothetical protein